jgi:catalase
MFLFPLQKVATRLPDGKRQAGNRLTKLGNNGDTIAPTAWPKWTSSVENRQASAEEGLGGMREVLVGVQ